MDRFNKNSSEKQANRPGYFYPLVVSTILGLLLPSLHLGFAPHNHKFDPASGQFFDVVRVDQEEVDGDVATIPAANHHLTRTSSYRLEYLRCTISNGMTLAGFWKTSLSISNPNVTEYKTAHHANREWRVGTLVSIAPKQSPPIA